jgi:diguanylate cyclase (GGDEF)-like protein
MTAKGSLGAAGKLRGSPDDRGVEDERCALGFALSERLDDVVDIQRRLAGETAGAGLRRSEFVDAARAFSAWLMTGEVDSVRIAGFGRLGAEQLAQRTITHQDATKLCLAWRDAVIRVLGDEAARLPVSSRVMDGAVEAANVSCDRFLVRLARQYDGERAELQASLDESRAQLIHQASHDPLTGLANRALLFDRLTDAVRSSDDERDAVAVLFVDLDKFKLINDHFGHEVGDCVLAAAAERLRSATRPGDTIARLGGDEFVILCIGINHADAEGIAGRVAQRIEDEFAAPFFVGETPVYLSASIGISVDRCTNGTPEELLSTADAAMYAAKRSPR